MKPCQVGTMSKSWRSPVIQRTFQHVKWPYHHQKATSYPKRGMVYLKSVLSPLRHLFGSSKTHRPSKRKAVESRAPCLLQIPIHRPSQRLLRSWLHCLLLGANEREPPKSYNGENGEGPQQLKMSSEISQSSRLGILSKQKRPSVRAVNYNSSLFPGQKAPKLICFGCFFCVWFSW